MGGFLGSDPAIYKTMKLDGHIAELNENDIVSKLGAVEKLGYKWSVDTGRLCHAPGPRSLRFDSPWVHGWDRADNTRNCMFDQQVTFGIFKMIPPRCLRCWKTCVGLKDYDTAMKVMEYQKTYPGNCKVGMERRDYTPRLWGAYFYNDSFDEGRDAYKKVREELVEVVGENNFDVILKRGCTEFELIKGPSLFWYNTEEETKFYEKLVSYFDDEKSGREQPRMVKDNILLKWVAWAHAHGDMSYMKYNNGKELYKKLVHYHEGDREKMKEEMALMLEMAKNKREGEG